MWILVESDAAAFFRRGRSHRLHRLRRLAGQPLGLVVWPRAGVCDLRSARDPHLTRRPASILSDTGARLRNAGLDVRHARAFSTPLGTGYVVSDTHVDLIGVAAPGFMASGGATCGRASLAKPDGAGGLQSCGSVGQASYVAILLRDATATVRRPHGVSRALPVLSMSASKTAR